jgi:murein DD-endopeptidase MepM/ murein hydrolase activator NlpD
VAITTSVAIGVGEQSFHLRAKSASRGSHYAGTFPFPTQTLMKWRFALFAGTQQAQHDASHVYELPFNDGEAVYVSQGYDGESTHVDEYEFALDFSLPVGSKIRSARAGTVALIVDGPCDNATGEGCANVRLDVRHEDGSYATYQHLMPGRLQVGPGDQVSAGQVLAFSGNSGNSAGPHLHFQVFTPSPESVWIVRSVPTLFRAENGVTLVEQGTSYRKPTFTRANMTLISD